MDGQTIISLLGFLGGLVTLGSYIVKAILKDRASTTSFERDQIIPTKEWLKREQLYNNKIDMLSKRIDDVRDMYEKKLLEKNEEIKRQNETFTSEIQKLRSENDSLRSEVNALRKNIVNAIQNTETSKKDVTP